MKLSITKLLSVIAFLLLFNATTNAQFYWQWWDAYHQWNGKTPQINYVTRTPAHMGPNALPVLPFRGTDIGYRTYFQMGADYHFSNEERTANPYIHLYFPIQKNRIAFEMYTRPIEYYETNKRLRDERYMRDSIAKGHSKGDTYFATRVRIWQHLYRLPDLTLEATLKTTTGKNLENARHINAPAYTFNGVLGKNIIGRDTSQTRLRWFLVAGTFIWQMNDNQQNDSFLYGVGLELKHKKWFFNMNAGGYRGYKNNGDRPVVARLLIQYQCNKIDWSMQYQYGFKNMIQSSINLSVKYKINTFDKWNKY